jgi:oligogalacturonide lyase
LTGPDDALHYLNMNDNKSGQLLSRPAVVRPVIRELSQPTRFHWGRREFRDSRTGRRVIQLTSGNSTNHSPYFYCNGFGLDETVVIVSSDLTGIFQLYRVDIATGDAMQLTDRPDGIGNLGPSVSHDGTEAFYAADASLHAVNLKTGMSRTVADLSENASGGLSFGLSGDGLTALLVYRNQQDRSVIATVPTAGGTPRVVFVVEQFNAICHTNFCLGDSNLITYVGFPDLQEKFDLDDAARARTQLLDIRTGTSRAFLTMPVGFRATHEYWNHDGSKLFFHKKRVPTWTPASIGYVDRAGGPQHIVYEDHHRKLGHSMINRQGTKIVCDNQEPGANDLIMIDVATGKAEVLCWTNASGRGHPNHIHPSFSPSGRHVLYTSDESGFAQTFVIPLD